MKKLKRKIEARMQALRCRLWSSFFTRGPGGPSRSQREFKLNRLQHLFCEWNADRLGISFEQSRARFVRSWNTIPNGHEGAEMKVFCELTQQVLSVFATDNELEVLNAYRLHEHVHFLRMLSYRPPTFEPAHPLIQGVQDCRAVTILDFGCGLAQRSWDLAERLKTEDRLVQLVLVDVPTLRKQFLLWLGSKKGIPVVFLDCTPEIPLPVLPACDVCIATEVFEHFHRPILHFRKMDHALRPGGFLITDVADHKEGFFHVTVDLELLRAEIAKQGYEEIQEHVLFRKPHRE